MALFDNLIKQEPQPTTTVSNEPKKEENNSNIQVLSEKEKNTLALQSFGVHNLPVYVDEKTIFVNWIELNLFDWMTQISLLILLWMKTCWYSDLHMSLEGEYFKIRWRKNQWMNDLTTDFLRKTFNEWNLSNYNCKYETIDQLEQILWHNKLQFHMENSLEKTFAQNLVQNIGSFTRNNVKIWIYQAQSTGWTIKVWNARKLDYRHEFTPTKYEWFTVFGDTIRLLDTKDIKPDYKHYQDIYNSYLGWKWIFILWWQTNSGKSTSIFGWLTKLYEMDKKKCYYSIENPIEKHLNFITQLEVQKVDNKENTMDFYDYIKSAMRMDWDVIFVWEIRDGETLWGSIQLSLSWHNIFSTIHIKNVFDLFNRVIEYGKKPIEMLNNTRCIIVQQLVPKWEIWSGIKIREIPKWTKTNNFIIDNLLDFRDTGKINIILNEFYWFYNKYLSLLENNKVVDSNLKSKIIESIKWGEETFLNYLIDNYEWFNTEETWMTLMFEMLGITPENKWKILEDEKGTRLEFMKTEDKFLPMGINALFLDKNFNINDMYDLTKIIY